MPDVVGIRFKKCGRIYNFEVNGLDAKPGMRIVVESEMGLTLGTVIVGRHYVEQTEQELKKVIRIATDEDIAADNANRSLEEEARVFCKEKVKNRNLPMKIVGTEATLDRKRLIFYFTADGRIDFRELVRDLASKFRTRIEMRQIGVRDEVKLIGSIGVCGREACCKTFLISFEPISIKMAKKHELALNPGKLSGMCGRLMCCLGYEIDEADREEKPISIAEEEGTLIITEEGIPEGFDLSLPVPVTETVLLSSSSQISEKERPIRDEERGLIHHKKDKGKPFSRRKAFLKKKKRSKDE